MAKAKQCNYKFCNNHNHTIITAVLVTAGCAKQNTSIQTLQFSQ